MLLPLSRIILVVLAAGLTVTLTIEILLNLLISPSNKCGGNRNDRRKSRKHNSDHVRQAKSRSSVYLVCGSEDQKMTAQEFFEQFTPLKVCAAIPGEGGDWSYILWTGAGHSWWAGDPLKESDVLG